MNKKAQTFLIAMIIIVIALISSLIIYNKVVKNNNFLSEKDLAIEFRDTSANIVTNAVYNSKDPKIALDEYIKIFIDISKNKNVHWTNTEVIYNDYYYKLGNNSYLKNYLSTINQSVGEIYFRFENEKNGEIFVIDQDSI